MPREVLKLNIPGVGIGVGYLINYGLTPQFSVALDGDVEPIRLTYQAAVEIGNVYVNDRPLSDYVLEGAEVNSPVLALREPAPPPAPIE